ncbi:hypothetical protein SEA_BENCZKOWSKI14_97 [Gordonia phage Benczkowski14]|uniref:Uncharacterized protein n=2 Tax=Demosthenesvirus katyusha TaxID=1982108 RepID=A0A142KCH4_9CAUD|nr:hypothetical protein FDH67_gp96 [Gordonia phage Katyusha]AMS03488.1 hypothetical protein SEA_KATYUSHA_95 [Gordonia phage Katyusha]AMS03807.1 hypothetical protein SEA_BENCZKOWSKI14_97 [Gordonia phage Benczkowski14]
MSHTRKYTSKYDQTIRTTKYRRPTKREQRELDRILESQLDLAFAPTELWSAPKAPNQLI